MMNPLQDATERIIALINSGRTDDALVLAAKTPDLPWDRVGEVLAASIVDSGSFYYQYLTHGTDRFHALLALGRWLAANGQPLRAYQCAYESSHLKPTEPSPHIMMGWLQLGMGNPRAAGRSFLAALRRDENQQEAIQGYQMALQQTADALPAIGNSSGDQEKIYHKAIDDTPDDFRLHLALGIHYAMSSRCTLAIPSLKKAHELAPHESEPAYWLAWSLTAIGDFQAAMDIALAATIADPSHIGLLKLAAECASHLGQEPVALEWLNQIIDRGFADSSVYANKGDCLNQLERFEEAAEALDHALSLDPSLLEARRNLAYSYHCLGCYDMALEHLDLLLQSEKNDFSARWYRATCLLATHRFQEGWRDYEFRFAATAVEGRIIPLPAWRGENLSGKKIVAVAEQGIGDEIMFAACFPALIGDSGHSVIECDARLVELFRRSFPQATIVERCVSSPWIATHGDADFHIFSGSLPLRYRPSLSDFSDQTAFLLAGQSQVEHFRQRLAELGQGLKIGIAWHGGGNASRTRTRSLRLEQLQPLFDIPGCIFVSIQYGDRAAEVAVFNRKSGAAIHHWPEAIADLDAFAALVSALDIIVTVCSAPVHFAGALGKPALVMTPHAPEWRYRGIEGRMLWYPSVRLFPQERLSDWTGAIRSVTDILRQKACADATAD